MIADNIARIAADLKQILADAELDPAVDFAIGTAIRQLTEQANQLAQGMDL